MKVHCTGVTQERRFNPEKKAEEVLSETAKFVPDAEVEFTEPQKETPTGGGRIQDPDGGKRMHKAWSTTITLSSSDPTFMGAFVEGNAYDVTISEATSPASFEKQKTEKAAKK